MSTYIRKYIKTVEGYADVEADSLEEAKKEYAAGTWEENDQKVKYKWKGGWEKKEEADGF